MPDKNVVERSIIPYNPASGVVMQKDKYNLFAPVADVNKVGMAGFNPADFVVKDQIVSASPSLMDRFVNKVNVLGTIPDGITYDGVDGIKTPNIWYYNYTNTVVDKIVPDGENEYITVTGALLEGVSTWVDDLNYVLTEVLLANGRIWTRQLEVVDGIIVTPEGSSAVPYFIPVDSSTVGPKGDKGDKGDTGPQGPMGPQGPQGEPGPEGPTGYTELNPTGDYDPNCVYNRLDSCSYDNESYVCTSDGVKGVIPSKTSPLWQLIAGEGPAGPQGPKGEQGPAGVAGPQGPEGPRGVAGPQGPQGLQGIQGQTGPEGPQGVRGAQGLKGDTGATGPQGPQGAPGPEGPRGQTGPEGPMGPTGPQGPQGLQGAVGPQGEQGPQGIQGPKGDKGDAGAVGLKGDPGEQGPQGLKGDTGAQGPAGAQGPQGPQGIQGEQGPQGIKGDTGAQGPAGAQGVQGPKGDKGDKGDDGQSFSISEHVDASSSLPAADVSLVGHAFSVGATEPYDIYVCELYGGNYTWVNHGPLQGPKGDIGPQGPQGLQGIQGPVGPQGPEGEQGPQGLKGDTGEQGPQGPQGVQGLKGDTGVGIASIAIELVSLPFIVDSPDIAVIRFQNADKSKVYNITCKANASLGVQAMNANIFYITDENKWGGAEENGRIGTIVGNDTTVLIELANYLNTGGGISYPTLYTVKDGTGDSFDVTVILEIPSGGN